MNMQTILNNAAAKNAKVETAKTVAKATFVGAATLSTASILVAALNDIGEAIGETVAAAVDYVF